MGLFSLPVQKFSVQETKDDRLLKIKLFAVSEGENRNNSSFTFESLKNSIGTISNTPILAHYDGYEKDVTDHRCVLKKDYETGETYYDFTDGERIIGVVNDSSEIKIENYNGRNWLTYTAYIFTQYNYQIKKMLQKFKKKKVSVEIFVTDKEEQNGIDIIKSFKLLGTTILGEKINEGIPGAHLMTYSKNNLKELTDCVNFTLNKSDANTEFVNKEEEKRKKFVEEVMVTKVITDQKVMAAIPSDYSFVGFSKSSIFASKDEKVFAFSYEVVEDEIKMSENSPQEVTLSAKEQVYAKFAVELLKEEEVVESVSLDLNSTMITSRMTEQFEAIKTEKNDMCEKYTEMCGKFEALTQEKEELCGKYAELEESNKKMAQELDAYKSKEFSNQINSVMSEFASLKQKEKESWVEKSKTYSDTVSFRKDLITYVFDTYGELKKDNSTHVEKFEKITISETSATNDAAKNNDPQIKLKNLFK